MSKYDAAATAAADIGGVYRVGPDGNGDRGYTCYRYCLAEMNGKVQIITGRVITGSGHIYGIYGRCHCVYKHRSGTAGAIERKRGMVAGCIPYGTAIEGNGATYADTVSVQVARLHDITEKQRTGAGAADVHSLRGGAANGYPKVRRAADRHRLAKADGKLQRLADPIRTGGRHGNSGYRRRCAVIHHGKCVGNGVTVSADVLHRTCRDMKARCAVGQRCRQRGIANVVRSLQTAFFGVVDVDIPDGKSGNRLAERDGQGKGLIGGRSRLSEHVYRGVRRIYKYVAGVAHAVQHGHGIVARSVARRAAI